MKKSRNKAFVIFLVAYVVVAMVAVNGFTVQPQIDRLRSEEGHVEGRFEISPMEVIGSGLIGGFRAPVVDYYWMKMIKLENDREYYDIPRVADLITKLQPNFPEVWVFNAWNLAYNIAVEWKAREDRWYYIRQGIETMKRGLQKDPQSVELEYYLGWLYFHKVSSDTGDPEYYWMMEQVKKEEGEEALLLAAKYFERAKDLGSHPVYSQQVLEMRELAADMQASRYLLIDKPRKEPGDEEKGFAALEKSVSLAEKLVQAYPDNEGFRNRIMGYCMEVLPVLMGQYPEEKSPERAGVLTDALARFILVVQSYNPAFQYIDVE
ncbi:MAG: hypothetical protein V2A58_14400 [Planctomycetota bacterium]